MLSLAFRPERDVHTVHQCCTVHQKYARSDSSDKEPISPLCANSFLQRRFNQVNVSGVLFFNLHTMSVCDALIEETSASSFYSGRTVLLITCPLSGPLQERRLLRDQPSLSVRERKELQPGKNRKYFVCWGKKGHIHI